MSYSDDGCMSVFTQDQKDRMITVIENAPRRKELLNSEVARKNEVTRIRKEIDEQIFIFPTPSSNRFTIKLTSNLDKGINFYDVTGQQVVLYPERISQDGKVYDYSVSHLDPGIYFVSFYIEGLFVKKKIIISGGE